MNILSISLEESKILNTQVLDWITSPEVKGGANKETFWIIKTDVNIYNPANDIEVEKLSKLLFLAGIHEFKFQNLIIRK